MRPFTTRGFRIAFAAVLMGALAGEALAVPSMGEERRARVARPGLTSLSGLTGLAAMPPFYPTASTPAECAGPKARTARRSHGRTIVANQNCR